MKVTALIPDNLIKELQQQTNAKTITDSLITALTDWLARKKTEELNDQIAQNPLTFDEEYSAANVRSVNQRR